MTVKNPKDQGRRDVLKGALSIGGIAAGISTTSNLLFPALAQEERLIPFTDDASEAFSWRPIEPNTTHWQDTREITSFSQITRTFIWSNTMVSLRLTVIHID